MIEVSVVIPCRNEARYIGPCLDSILANDFPRDRLEILVVDGASDDGTRRIVSGYAARYPFLRMLDNPALTTPYALNIGIRASTGDRVMRMDAHCTYPADYIRKCVAASQRLGAENVGGRCIIAPLAASRLAEAIGIALGHPFGVGNSRYRVPQLSAREREVDTVPFGCFKRQVFSRIGYFDERLTRNQDLEFNLRLRATGGRVILLPDVQINYHPRTDFGDLLRQNFRTGFWTLYAVRFGRRAFSLRHLVPGLFVAVLLLTGLAGFGWVGAWWLTALVAASYLAATWSATVTAAWRWRSWHLLLTLPVVFAGLHAAYGLGTVAGLFGALWPSGRAGARLQRAARA